MEKKKLLLVAISVGIFLVIAIGAAIVFMPKSTGLPSGAISHSAPASRTTPSPSYTSVPETPEPELQPSPVDPVDLVRNPGDAPGLKPAPEGTIRQGGDYYVSGAGSDPGGASAARSPETVISVPKPSTAAVPDTPQANRVVSAPAPRPAPAAPRPAAPAAKPATQTKAYNDFWVQTGAFSTVSKAEGVKETLASKGITSIIENRDVEGRTLFRVRVGPYTSKNEADYWLSLIKSINGFEDSQVRQTQSRR